MKKTTACVLTLLTFSTLPSFGADSADQALYRAASSRDGLPQLTNQVQALLAEAKNRKETASRLMLKIMGHQIVRPIPESIEFLLSEGGDPKFEDTDPQAGFCMPLRCAAILSDVKILNLLVQRGAEINHYCKAWKHSAFEDAVGRGDKRIVAWMLEHGAKLQEKETDRSLLAAAIVGLNPEDMVPLLLKLGADPYAGHSHKHAAVDLWAERRDIDRLREFDTNGLYRALVEKYTPPKDSPFFGTWSNGEEEFKTFGVIMNNEGQAIVATSIMPLGPFLWRAEGKQAVVEVEQGGKRGEMTFEFDADGKSLVLVKPSGKETGKLKKVSDKAPTAAQLRSMRRSQ